MCTASSLAAAPTAKREGLALGYDVARLHEGLRRFRRSLKSLDSRQIRRMVAHQPNLWDFFNLCDGGSELLEWFHMRAGLLAARMAEFRDAINEAADSEQPFGSDVFPPSVALLGGHDYTTWSKSTDYLTGGSSFGGVVGWATMVSNLAGEWAPALCRWNMATKGQWMLLKTRHQRNSTIAGSRCWRW